MRLALKSCGKVIRQADGCALHTRILQPSTRTEVNARLSPRPQCPTMNDSIAQVSGRGTVTLPADLRRKLGLRRGDVLAVRLTGGSIVLTPAVVTPVELYTDERIAEFGRNADLAADELAAARRT